MPPGRRGRGRGAAPASLLGKRAEPEFELENALKPPRRVFENQSSFATFMQKKGDVIQQLLDEKSAFFFKNEEWVEKKEKMKKHQSKHTKNLK